MWISEWSVISDLCEWQGHLHIEPQAGQWTAKQIAILSLYETLKIIKVLKKAYKHFENPELQKRGVLFLPTFIAKSADISTYKSINSSSNTLLTCNVVQSQLRKLEVVQHEHPATLHWQPIKCKHLKSAAWGSVFPSAHGAWLRSPFKGISVPKCTWEGISVLCVAGKIYT